ncbi:MAG: cation:proton antiporter, partial [Anaerolineae bacterium]
MDAFFDPIFLLAGFGIISLAASRIGALFARLGLPKITGYLFTGLVAGPFVLGLIPEEAPHHLLFVDEFSLAFIAFAAGSELYLPELRGRLRSIGLVTVGLVLVTFTFGLVAVMLLADHIPFIRQLDTTGRLAVALLVATIMVARSPSSAIAIVNELRAKGPYTRMALGVTVIMDVVVIALFAVNSSAADAILANVSISATFVLLLLLELSIAVAAGYGLYKLLAWSLSLNIDHRLKIVLLLVAGYAVFVLSGELRAYTHATLPFEVLVEPLLVCLIASFMLNNYSPYRLEMAEILHQTGPIIYILFFTLTGASLELGLLLQTWPIALALFLV